MKLSERLTVRLTIAELRAVTSAARAAGITPSELVRRLLTLALA